MQYADLLCVYGAMYAWTIDPIDEELLAAMDLPAFRARWVEYAYLLRSHGIEPPPLPDELVGPIAVLTSPFELRHELQRHEQHMGRRRHPPAG